MSDHLLPLIQQKPKRPFAIRIGEHFLLANWWLIACLLLSYACYERSAAQFRWEYARLSRQQDALWIEHQGLTNRIRALEKQIHSQSDPAWVELTLMKVLGTLREGERKVYFREAE